MERSRIRRIGVWHARRAAGLSERSDIRHEFLADNRARVTSALCLCLFEMSMSQASFFGSKPFSILLSINVLFLHRYKVKYGFDFTEDKRLVFGFDSRKATRANGSFRPILFVSSSQVLCSIMATELNCVPHVHTNRSSPRPQFPKEVSRRS